MQSKASRRSEARRQSRGSIAGKASSHGGPSGAGGAVGPEEEKRKVDDSMIGTRTQAWQLLEYAEPKDQASQEG